MRLIKALIITLAFSAQAGLPPTTLSGQSSATKPTTFGTQVPYNQATSLGGINSLIETGSENMLVDPGMEAPGVTAYTCTVGTCTKTVASGEFSSGKQALKVALAAQALNVSQSVSTVAGIQAQGVVGALYRVPSAITDFQVCSLVAGAEQTCVPANQLIADNTFRSIEIPVTMTPGSTVGIKFKTTASYTQNVFFDAAYARQGLGTQNLMLDNVFSAQISATGVVSGENKDFISGNCTNANPFVCTFATSIFTVTPTCTATFATNVLGSTYPSIQITAQSSASISIGTSENPSGSIQRAFTLTCQKSGNDYLASSANVYSSTNGNYSGRNDGTITLNTGTKGTIVTDRIISSRYGNRLKAEYQYEQSSAGTIGSGDYLFTLPSSLQFDTNEVVFYTGASANAAVPKSIVGTSLINNTATPGYLGYLVAYNATQFRVFWYYNGVSTTIFSSSSAYNFAQSTMGLGFKIDAPIQGWSNANVIVGSFEKIEKCASVNECTDVYSAQVTTTSGAVANSNVSPNWLSCTAANPTVCTFTAGIFTVAPNCHVTDESGSTTGLSVISTAATSTSVAIQSLVSNTGGLRASTLTTLSCQKTGVDSKPKTAKIASSIGVPTVPGITTEAIDTFSVSYGTTNATTVCSASPCSYLDQIGTAVSSITRSSAGTYSLNTIKTYAKLKCTQGMQNAATVAISGLPMSCTNCSALGFQTYSYLGSISDSYGIVYCQGSY